MTYNHVLKEATEYLKEHEIDDPSYEAGLLLCWVLKKDLSYIYARLEEEISPIHKDAYLLAVQRRAVHEPFSYITNERWFMGLDFYVDKHVLIPREETELIVEAALCIIGKERDGFSRFDADFINAYTLPKKDSYKILDVGTGSGCIAISLAKLCEHCFVDAIDISSEALNVAKKNAYTHGVQDKIRFIKTDLFTLEDKDVRETNDIKKGSYNILISNPPYIPAHEISTLMRSVKDYEPLSALHGGSDGLLYYAALARNTDLLSDDGVFIMEFGPDQSDEIANIFNAFASSQDYGGLFNYSFLTDYSKHLRAILLKRQ